MPKPSARNFLRPVFLCAMILTPPAACLSGEAPALSLPPRPADALSGSQVTEKVSALPLVDRERVLAAEILAGNVPGFLRKLCPVTLTNCTARETNRLTVFVAPDYLAVGSDTNYFLTPLSPATGRRIANTAGCCLPTPKLVDAIHSAAAVKLAPTPIPPSPAMTSVAVFSNHNALVWEQRRQVLAVHPLGALVAGNKKDVVLSAKLAGAPGKVAIYGWHRTNGTPIQPLYLGHTNAWVDYSHGIRLVSRKASFNGREIDLANLLSDPALAILASDEGRLEVAK